MRYHGSGNRAGRASWRRPSIQKSREPRQAPAALGPKVRSLVREDIDTEIHRGTAEITDCRYVASYNLMDGLTKTILVPGRPPLWTPSSDTMRLDADAGDYYRDENAARFQEYPLEPAVRSIFHMNPSSDPTAIDVFACGSTLGNLLRFVQGRGEPFSFVVRAVGRTAFFIRRGFFPTELIDGVWGFGHAFVDANTTWSRDVKGSSSHQRIISYRFGGNNVMVRFEADGYTMDQTDEFDSEDDDDGTAGVPVRESSSSSPVEDELARMSTRPRGPAEATDRVTILNRGSPTAQSSTLDIKTRSARKQREQVMAEQLPRLWVRQIDNVVLSFHERGVFGPAAVEDIHSMILDWEEEHQAALAQLANLIDVIRAAAKAAEGGMIEVRCSEAATVQFHELPPAEWSRWHAMPDDLEAMWVSH